MIVDAHNHFFFPTNKPGVKAVLLDPSVLVNSGVIKRTWLLSTGDTFAGLKGNQDQQILHLAKTYKGFFVPFAYLDFTKKPDIVDYFHKQGFAGLKAIFPPFAYDDERCFPFYEKAEKSKMPILFHVGGSPYWVPEQMQIGPERMASKNMLIITLDLVAKMFPKLVIITAHMGGKHSYDFAVYFAKGHPNVYLDTSCSIVERDSPDKIKEVIKIVGPDKILFGSDVRGDGPIKKALFWKSYFEAKMRDQEIGHKIMSLNAERIISESGFNWKNINLSKQE
ncbi:MAG: amidohydrolase family protein [bacterium]|nr:amidohydrolase family protein [bacterium]